MSKAQSHKVVGWGTKARGPPLPGPPHISPGTGSGVWDCLSAGGSSNMASGRHRMSFQIVGNTQEG